MLLQSHVWHGANAEREILRSAGCSCSLACRTKAGTLARGLGSTWTRRKRAGKKTRVTRGFSPGLLSRRVDDLRGSLDRQDVGSTHSTAGNRRDAWLFVVPGIVGVGCAPLAVPPKSWRRRPAGVTPQRLLYVMMPPPPNDSVGDWRRLTITVPHVRVRDGGAPGGRRRQLPRGGHVQSLRVRALDGRARRPRSGVPVRRDKTEERGCRFGRKRRRYVSPLRVRLACYPVACRQDVPTEQDGVQFFCGYFLG